MESGETNLSQPHLDSYDLRANVGTKLPKVINNSKTENSCL